MNRFLFQGKTAVITGAAGGIGRLYALELASRGCNVVINDVESALDGSSHASSSSNTSRLDAVLQEARALGVEAIGNRDSVLQGESIIEDALRAFGKVDILINNAGILRDKSFLKQSFHEWQSVLDVHLTGTMRLCKAVWPHMTANKYGRIVNIGSSAGLYGNFGQTNYSAAKMGILGFTNSLACEGDKYNIKVNCVIPVADSRMTESVLSTEVRDLLHPSHITPLVLYLSHENNTCNGATYEIGGGFYSKVCIERSKGVKLGSKGSFASVETIAAHMEAVSDFSQGSYRASSLADSLQNILSSLQESSFEATSSIPPPVEARKTPADMFKSVVMRNIQHAFTQDKLVALKDKIGVCFQVKVYSSSAFISKDNENWLLDFQADVPHISLYDSSPQIGDSTVGVTISVDEETLSGLVSRKVSPEYAFMRGRIRIKGNPAAAMKIKSLFE